MASLGMDKPPHSHWVWPGHPQKNKRKIKSKNLGLVITPHPNDTQYCTLLALPNQNSQGITYPDTTIAKAHLTAKFW
jgi:hypothetical protein